MNEGHIRLYTSFNPGWKSSQQIPRIKPYRASKAAETTPTRSARMVSFLSLLICILTAIIMIVEQDYLYSRFVVSSLNGPEPQFRNATNTTIEVSFRRSTQRITKNYTPFTVSFANSRPIPPVPANPWPFYVLILPVVWLGHLHRML